MLSVVIPTLNAGQNFADLLARLRSQQTSDRVETIVIDSSSTDNTVSVARAAGAQTVTIPRKSFNHGTTRNRAIREANGDTVILMSQDALPANANLLENLAKNFQNPAVAGVFARHQPYPHHPKHIRESVLLHNGAQNRTESTLFAQGFEVLTPFQRFLACRFDNVCSAIRKSVWERIPFPEKDFAEDLAWSKAVLLENGGGRQKIVYDPTALVIHSHDLTLRQLYTRTRQTHRALGQLFDLQTITNARQLPSQLRHHRPATVAHLAYAFATVLGSYHGARATQ